MRVLVLTFNRTLRGYIDQLATEHVHATDELDLTVETFGRWARGLVGQRRVLDSDGVRVIAPLLTGMGLPVGNLDYFVDEVRYLQGRFPKHRLDRYLEAARAGRGRSPAVPRELRDRLLANVVQPYEAWKADRNFADWNDIALEAAEVPCQGYDIVIVDESQDLSANQVRAISAHLSEDHVTTFVIDAVQRIYPQGFQWNEVGIGMNPPKRQVFVDSFSFEEPNRRGTHKKSTTPSRATTKNPKANRKKAMPQPAAQPRKPKARVEPTPAKVEARQERQREYERRRAQTPERKELKRRITQERRDKAKLLGICVGCWAPPTGQPHSNLTQGIYGQLLG